MKANANPSLRIGAVCVLAALLPLRGVPEAPKASAFLEYYGEIGCSHCDAFEEEILPAAAALSGAEVELLQIDILAAEGYERCRVRLAEFGQEFRIFPVLVIGNNAYQGNTAIEENLVPELEHFVREGVYRPRGAPAEGVPAAPGVRLGFLPILAAGLVDGINPCAFATLLFFLSFMSLGGAGRGRIAGIGLLFAAGVFTAYLLLGMGLFNLLRSGIRMAGFRSALRILVTVLTVSFCALTVRDIILLRRGNVSDMEWGLPDALRNRIHSAIRSGARSAVLPVGVFATGLVVAVLELACTGQVYFPTLSYMVQTDPGWLGIGSLLLYNLAFILPLLVVLALILLGVRQERIRRFFQSRVALAKVLLALTFAALAVLVWIF